MLVRKAELYRHIPYSDTIWGFDLTQIAKPSVNGGQFLIDLDRPNINKLRFIYGSDIDLPHGLPLLWCDISQIIRNIFHTIWRHRLKRSPMKQRNIISDSIQIVFQPLPVTFPKIRKEYFFQLVLNSDQLRTELSSFLGRA